MRIVAVADTHLYHTQLVVPRGDVFVHAGDLCRFGDLDELAEAAAWIRSLPHRYKVVVAGNHDWAFVHHPREARALLGKGVVYLEDSGVCIDGITFWGSPWQPAFHDWAFNLPRGEALAEKWAAIPEGIDVLITHSPPFGIGDRSWSEVRHGCADLMARVRQVKPRLHIFGHIHEDGGVFREEEGVTCFANVTTWECARRPTVLDIAGEVVTEIDVPKARR
ncbi:metallophosphatase domain-containing protein [Polyangium sp. 15x6]|uniref:metallophosphatase domain-containing protein n=1 Tax=Polyangium sp. 15x6 TaxID=3042687 RepID=UPI00249C121F|nr:metallophosphatase domain-containing protein [Polyangium sp. 15x6]MDI3286077.1 metallophosphatase domain-containing protein [Polyangium sp. 15x6]